MLPIARVRERPSVQKRPVNVRDHASDVPRAARLRLVLTTLDVGLHPLVPKLRVPLVHAVYGPPLRDRDLRMRQDELPEARVEREPVDVPADRQDEVAVASVHAIPRGDHALPGLQRVLRARDALLRRAINPEDGSHAHAAVDVAAAVERIEHAHVPSGVGGLAVHRVFDLLAHEHRASLARVEHPDEDVVRDDVELHLRLALDVLPGVRLAAELGESHLSHAVLNVLARRRDGLDEDAQVRGVLVLRGGHDERRERLELVVGRFHGKRLRVLRDADASHAVAHQQIAGVRSAEGRTIRRRRAPHRDRRAARPGPQSAVAGEVGCQVRSTSARTGARGGRALSRSSPS
mmetsp:Transcript_12900/g.46357  ORF Transcript_12900/g.46357 Transcript_12900/m.46357 type:complete len:348 (+) Transcript_12900:486-1529(+)